jgi:two-component system chemotaxis response regulator CheY
MKQKTLDQIKVLAIDDMEFVLNTVSQFLTEMGFEPSNIYKARTGKEAIELLKSKTVNGPFFDLILCDWKMPGLTGIQVLEKVRKSRYYSKCPFIMITTDNERAHVVQALKLHVNNYIIKPFNEESFRDKIYKTLNLHELDQ